MFMLQFFMFWAKFTAWNCLITSCILSELVLLKPLPSKWTYTVPGIVIKFFQSCAKKFCYLHVLAPMLYEGGVLYPFNPLSLTLSKFAIQIPRTNPVLIWNVHWNLHVLGWVCACRTILSCLWNVHMFGQVSLARHHGLLPVPVLSDLNSDLLWSSQWRFPLGFEGPRRNF